MWLCTYTITYRNVKSFFLAGQLLHITFQEPLADLVFTCSQSTCPKNLPESGPESKLCLLAVSLSDPLAWVESTLYALICCIYYSLEPSCILSLARVINLPFRLALSGVQLKFAPAKKFLSVTLYYIKRHIFCVVLKWLVSYYALYSYKGNLVAETIFNCESVFKKGKTFHEIILKTAK